MLYYTVLYHTILYYTMLYYKAGAMSAEELLRECPEHGYSQRPLLQRARCKHTCWSSSCFGAED